MKKSTKIAVILVSVTAILALLVIVFISPITKYAVEKYDKQFTGRQITMDWAYVNPFSGYIHFDNVRIREFESDSIFISMSGISTHLKVFKLLSKTVEIEDIVLDKPIVTVIQSKKKFNFNDLIELLGFQKSKDKEIRYFSSGMRQRLKLALAICSDSPILLLDEPTTNLDVQGVEWYRGLMAQYTEGSSRLVVIASNAPHDYDFCDATMNILDYKQIDKKWI